MPEVVGRLRTPRLAAAPSAPVQGEMYFDTATSKLYWWDGTTWVAASGGGGAASLAYQQQDLVSNVTITNTGQDYDVNSLTLTPGTWLVIGQLCLRAGAATCALCAKLDLAGTTVSHCESRVTANQDTAAITVSAIVTVAVSTVVKTQARSSTTGSTVRVTAPTGGTNNATNIKAVQIA